MTIHIGGAEGAPKKEPRPHRCNDRVEDVIQALFEGYGNYKNTLAPAWSLMWKCFRSPVGEEPKDPYFFVTPDNPAFRNRPPPKRRQGQNPWGDSFEPEGDTKDTLKEDLSGK